MKSAFVVLTVIFVFGATVTAYLIYRHRESSSANVARYLLSGEKIAPTFCSIGGGDFQHSINGTLYITDVALRADYLQIHNGVVNHVHVISPDGQVIYLWSDDDAGAFTMNRAQFISITDLTRTGGECQPWWSPDESIFKIPRTIIFKSGS